MAERINLELPADFNFRTAVFSHGWYDLAPYRLDLEIWTLSGVFRDPNEDSVHATIFVEEDKLVIEADGELSNPARLIRYVRHILRLDEELAEFYRLTNRHKRLRWVSEMNAGRLLRSPTVFEDLVKTICTTNCSWGLTKSMVANLVEKLGEASSAGQKAFPTAEAMAAVSADFYRDEIRAGYRSPYFAELAKKVADGSLDPESWLDSDLPTTELKRAMKTVKGVGDYAAENLLKLVGRYDGLALDSWLRSQFYIKHNNGDVCDDKQIALFYEEFGRWRGLAIWCDMTEKWH